MGINVKVQKHPKQKNVITAEAKLERDLRSCMRCRFFYGNRQQCIAKKCVRDEVQTKEAKEQKNSKCVGCPYHQSEQYCFPCMKEILGITEKKETDIAIETEEKKDG